MRRSKGLRSRTRNLKSRSKIKITDILKKLEIGDKVAVVANPSDHRAIPHRRFHGRVGEIIGTRGSAYIIRIKDGDKEKTLITMATHLKKLQ